MMSLSPNRCKRGPAAKEGDAPPEQAAVVAARAASTRRHQVVPFFFAFVSEKQQFALQHKRRARAPKALQMP